MTIRQQEVYNFILKFQYDNGYPPTRAEIAHDFGFTVNAATDHLAALQKKGVITIAPKISRGIAISGGQHE